MNKEPSDFLREWRDTANSYLAKDPEHPIGQTFQRCANELELSLKGSRQIIGATALLASAIVLTEPFLSRSDLPSDTTHTSTWATPLQQAPTEALLAPADHTHEERSEDNMTYRVSADAVSGPNVAAKTSQINLHFADSLREG